MPIYKTCQIKSKNIQLINKHAAWRKNPEITAHFNACANERGTGESQCVVLLDEKNSLYVGFIGLTLTVEDLLSEINIYVSIEFVFLHKKVRRRGLSSYFIEHVINEVTQWLNVNSTAWIEKNVILYSASTARSDAGSTFLKRLDERLREEANQRRYSFKASVDNDLDHLINQAGKS